MRVIYYPDQTDKEDGFGPVVRFFKKLRKERPPKLWVLVRETLENVERSSSLGVFERQGWVERMPYCKEPVFEFRIPPTRRGGVVRLYFAYKKHDSSTIVILDAEMKKGRSKADKNKVRQAERRYREVCI